MPEMFDGERRGNGLFSRWPGGWKTIAVFTWAKGMRAPGLTRSPWRLVQALIVWSWFPARDRETLLFKNAFGANAANR